MAGDRRRQFVRRRPLQPEHQVPQAAHLELVLRESLGVAPRVPGDVAVGALGVRFAQQAVPARQRVQRARGGDQKEPVPHEVEFVDHLRAQQRHQVREHAVTEARKRLLAQRGAADDRTALQHHDIQPGPGQVGRGDETVVAGADDDRVEAAAGAGRI